MERAREVDAGLVAAYLNAYYATLTAVWAGMSRLGWLNLLLSLALLALAFGVFQVEEQVELGGVRVSVPLPIFMVGGALAVTVLLISYWLMLVRGNLMEENLQAMYRVLGVRGPQGVFRGVHQHLGEDADNPFYPPDAFMAFEFSLLRRSSLKVSGVAALALRLERALGRLLTFGITFLIPLSAQVAAGTALVRQGSAGWALVVFLCAVASLASFALAAWEAARAKWLR